MAAKRIPANETALGTGHFLPGSKLFIQNDAGSPDLFHLYIKDEGQTTDLIVLDAAQLAAINAWFAARKVSA